MGNCRNDKQPIQKHLAIARLFWHKKQFCKRYCSKQLNFLNINFYVHFPSELSLLTYLNIKSYLK